MPKTKITSNKIIRMRHRPEDREPEVPNGERAFQTIDFASTLAAITSSA